MKALLQICMMFYFSTVTLFGQSSKNEIDNKIDKANELLDAMNRSDEAMPILLQSYEESKSINYQKGLLESNKAFARLHIDRGNYKKVIEFASDAETIGKELKDYTSLAAIYRLRGVAFMRLGFLDDGFKDTKLALENAKKVEDESKRHYYTALSDHNLVYYYQNKNAPQDTILKYLMDGLSESEQIKDDAKSVNDKYFMVINLHVSIGMFYAGIHQPQRLDLAEKHLLTALKYKETQPFAFKKDELNTFNSLGRFYDESGNATEAIKYASQVLQIEKNSKSPLDRHIAYATLANSYEVLEDKDMMNKYLTLYSNLGDSINKAQKNVDVPLKQIMSDNEEVHNKEIDNLLMIGAGILALLVLLSFIFWKIQKRILHKKYASLIEKLSLKQNAEDQTEQETEQDIKKSVQKQLITDKTTESLLVGLHKFEKSKHFTRKDASLTWLANSLSTNTRTLSEVIKLHKQKSFNDYINGLRINYIMELLYDEPKHREYKISYLAELCGFSSREVFAVIFKKESGISPSYFINNLKKEIDINPLPAKEFHE